MRHIIDRVLELQDSDSEPPIVPAPQDGDLAELLKTLQPRIRVYGCGGKKVEISDLVVFGVVQKCGFSVFLDDRLP